MTDTPAVTPSVEVTSFGYGQPGGAPEADLVLDARRLFRNPHHDPAMRYRTGLEDAVRTHVLTTPGVPAAVRGLASAVVSLLPTGRPVRVAVGCVGGRHRSVTIAVALADLLHRAGVTAAVTHRDVTRPVIQRRGEP